jgi:hypothetical protein
MVLYYLSPVALQCTKPNSPTPNRGNQRRGRAGAGQLLSLSGFDLYIDFGPTAYKACTAWGFLQIKSGRTLDNAERPQIAGGGIHATTQVHSWRVYVASRHQFLLTAYITVYSLPVTLFIFMHMRKMFTG